MIQFQCDYTEGCHPKILEKLTATNLEQTPGYGEDKYCAAAAEKIRTLCGRPDAAVHFLVGGTQTNTTVISAALRPHQGVLAADTGHIAVHETGAIEATGHKVITLPNPDGKITAAQVDAFCKSHWDDPTFEHQPQPGMVYISFPTEDGTLYSKAELSALYETCKKWEIPLFVDGARLGYGLVSSRCDITLQDLASLCDVFYIGGTKQGALFGEALVITHPALKKDFRYFIKRHGGMLAKGRLLGLQFDVLFTDGLYFDLARHAVELAMEIRAALEEAKIPLYFDSYTNQQFPVLPDDVLAVLSQKYMYSGWCRVDGTHTAVRFATSWATRREDVDKLLADIHSIRL